MITCRRLLSVEYHNYSTFMNSRSEDSRRMFFGYNPSKEFINGFVSKMQPPKDIIIVAENKNLEIIGTVHIASMKGDQVEIGIMIDENFRGQGISTKLMDFAMLWCKNRGLANIYMHCLSYNGPIMHIVRKYGLEVHKEGTEADSYITLPRPTALSMFEEQMIRSFSNLSRAQNSALVSFSKMCSVMQ